MDKFEIAEIIRVLVINDTDYVMIRNDVDTAAEFTIKAKNKEFTISVR